MRLDCILTLTSRHSLNEELPIVCFTVMLAAISNRAPQLRTAGLSPAKVGYTLCRYWPLLTHPVTLWVQAFDHGSDFCQRHFKLPLYLIVLNVRPPLSTNIFICLFLEILHSLHLPRVRHSKPDVLPLKLTSRSVSCVDRSPLRFHWLQQNHCRIFDYMSYLCGDISDMGCF